MLEKHYISEGFFTDEEIKEFKEKFGSGLHYYKAQPGLGCRYYVYRKQKKSELFYSTLISLDHN